MYAKVIDAVNVNDALLRGLLHLAVAGELSTSRNGPVLVAPAPVITSYQRPQDRVLWSPLRDANPFFHLHESIWMLAGRNDTASLEAIVPRMGSFSDDDKTLNGAYGFRWREYFGWDQLTVIVDMLRKDPSTRRAVLAMWDAAGTALGGEKPDLLNQTSKDLPCNTHIYFDGSRGTLDMTVCCRSNDAIWGAYGANAVHFGFLHEFVALAAGLPQGTYHQVSNNFHVYPEREDTKRLISLRDDVWTVHYADEYDAYQMSDGFAVPLIRDDEFGRGEDTYRRFLNECKTLLYMAAPEHSRPSFYFLNEVYRPMIAAHRMHKAQDTPGAIRLLRQYDHSDWASAGIFWLQRRLDKQAGKTA